jgi:Tfp pilus assembly protein PilZ
MHISKKTHPNKRKEPRQVHDSQIFFSYKKHLHEGELKNYSPSGLFINTDNFFLEGERITIVLPMFKSNDKYRCGRIVWKNAEGFGVQLLK